MIGTVTLVVVMIVAYRFDQLPFIASDRVVSADFSEIGTLRPGDDVLVSGATVGEVRKVEIVDQHVKVTFRVDELDLTIGSSSEARVVTTTLLGQAALEIRPAGDGNLARGDAIGIERTSSPYDITQALSQLTTEIDDIDVSQLSDAVSTAAEVFEDSPEDLRATVDGVTQLADVLAANDAELTNLVGRAREVSGVLADRDAEISTLLRSGDQLLGQLSARRDLVVQLVENVELVATQLSALVADNAEILQPTLDQVNGVLDLLNENRENLEGVLSGVAAYAMVFGEALSSGPFFDAYVANLTEPATLVPVLSDILEGLPQ
ncbi:virulence factor Mce family protein [Aeromicrobium marinum DSM 15272]|uniref:Virulence factor Mce family protein n=1 Tax=Aeromicrobium marinum DSM 15272 TaxID=585531 RepID=E2S873_9ACTN|nr:MCE family protein [Aeromicrobium marinum]EFQ84378.1 virulence factor Mce family protein [Aeromicrobium marinum DSM 15272]